jgi:hypothetical protein
MSLVGRIEALATRIGQECKLIWADVNGKEPAFTKNTAFNKNFGSASGTVCQGNDSRLSDNRTPTNASVSYTKVASDLTDRATDNDGTWDFSNKGIIDAAIISNTTVSFSNLKQNKILKVKIVITNSAEITLPSYCTILEGSAEASGNNGTYYFYFDCWESESQSEEVLVSISKAAS